MLFELIHNIAVLLAFSLFYDYSWVKKEGPRGVFNKIVTGLIIGGIGVFLMLDSWTLTKGIVLDTRSILLAISGLFFGTIPTVVAMAITGFYRIMVGNDGMWMGLTIIFSSGTIGILWRRFRPRWRGRYYWLELLVIGIIVHIIMLACTALIPSNEIWSTLRTITLPVMLLYPVGTMLLGILMVRQFHNWQNKKAKEDLLRSEQRFTEMFKKVNLLCVILDDMGTITFCNPYFLENTGYLMGEVIGANWFKLFIAPDKRTEIENVFRGIQKEEKFSMHNENEIVKKNGERTTISWNNILLRAEDNTVMGVASIGENITEKRASEEQKLRMANILEASLNEIYVFDAKTLIFDYVNYGALKNLGYSQEEIKTLTPLDIKPDYTLETFNQLIQPLRDHEKSVIIFETRHRRADGSHYPIEVHLQLFEYNRQQIFLAIIQDITVRKHTEAQLIEAKERAEESDRLKSIFLANMSHEIRTPMNAIMGFSGLLTNPGLVEEKRKRYIDIIHNASSRLLQLINDIIDISKIEAKQLNIKLTACNLFSIFTTSVETFQKSELLKSKRRLKLRLNLPEDCKDLFIETDSIRVQQVLDNLLSNAIKYSKKGFVETGFTVKSEDDHRFIEIYVKDTGIGISPDMNELIFERFRQIEERQYHKGVGLGLSISKGIVELLGGKIWFESEKNKGTVFYFTLPYNLNRHTENRPSIGVGKTPDLSGKTIIIAEDDDNSFNYLFELMGGLNAELLRAENGLALMNLLEEMVPDLILLDMNMPVKSGFKCLQEIQDKGLKLNIIAQTAYAMPDEKEKCFKAGCRGYISKPVDRTVLFIEINKLLTADS